MERERAIILVSQLRNDFFRASIGEICGCEGPEEWVKAVIPNMIKKIRDSGKYIEFLIVEEGKDDITTA